MERKGEQPFLHATHCFDHIYMPTKYYQNISKGMKVIERTNFCIRTDAWLMAISPNLVDQGIKIETYSTKFSFCCLGHAPGVGCWR